MHNHYCHYLFNLIYLIILNFISSYLILFNFIAYLLSGHYTDVWSIFDFAAHITIITIYYYNIILSI